MSRPLILVVDDAPEMIHIVRLLARRSGQDVIAFNSSDSALAAVRTAGVPHPDLLLLDIHLPGSTGVQLYRELRAGPAALIGVPAALFSQGVAPAVLSQALEAGIEFMVSKDLLARPEDWKQRIDEVLWLAANPLKPAPPTAVLEPGRLRQSVQTILAHPVLSRLGDEAVWALWRAASRAAGDPVSEAADVDVVVSSGSLITYLTRLVGESGKVARLLGCLGRQVECLLGRAASEPLRAAVASALEEARSGEGRQLL